MTDLLTRAEDAAIAAEIDLPSAPFMDGKFRAGKGPALVPTNPATGEVLTTIAAAGAEEHQVFVEVAERLHLAGRQILAPRHGEPAVGQRELIGRLRCGHVISPGHECLRQSARSFLRVYR